MPRTSGQSRLPHSNCWDSSEPGGMKAIWRAASSQLAAYGPRPNRLLQRHVTGRVTVGVDRLVIFLETGGVSNPLDPCQELLTVSGTETLLRFVADEEANSKSRFSKSAETEEIIRKTDPMVFILRELLLELFK